MLIYGYVRQSSAEQVRYGYNLEEQERQIREYCECHYKESGYNLKIYIDAGKSGTNMKRPELQKLLNDSKKHKPNVVIFHNIDRLSRELSDLWTMIKFFTKHDIKLVSVVSYIDLNSAYGTGNVLNEGLSAMIESMKISDRTIRAYKEAVKQGKYPFSGCPRGYKKIDKHLYPSDNQRDIDIINHIFNYFANNEGTIAKLRKELILNYGFKITDDNISKIVKNKIYIGTIEYKDIVYENFCEPIISTETFDNANNLISKKRRSRTKVQYIFKNKLYCENCKCYMVQTAGTSKKKVLYAYYKCPCCHKYVSQIKLLDDLDIKLDSLTIKYINDLNGYNDLINQIKDYRTKQLQLVELQKVKPIDVDDFYNIYHEYQSKIDKLEIKSSQIYQLIKRFSELDIATKREVVDHYIKSINITFLKKGTYKTNLIEIDK